jgi:type II restriction enzyme
LSPGGQSLLVKKILDDFCVFFLPAAEVVYIGDTAERFAVLERQLLEELGVRLPEHGKLPDVVVFDRDRNWLVLIEAVESGGEIDAKRRRELQRLFLGCRAGLVFVSAFHTRQTFKRHLSAIAWETEVWIAENPTHLIHFDGNKFLGPFAEPV